MLPESRIVAQLLLDGVDEENWRQMIEGENILQKRSVASALRQANLIRTRLRLMDAPHWKLVAEGSSQVATHALLAAAVKHSRILADFMDLSLRDLYQRLESQIPKGCWSNFLEGCAARDPEMPQWSDVTQRKLRNTIFQILHETGYVTDTRKLVLQRVDIVPEVRAYLTSQGETRILNCLEICP
jgi:hypothetical protein